MSLHHPKIMGAFVNILKEEKKCFMNDLLLAKVSIIYFYVFKSYAHAMIDLPQTKC